LRSRLELQVPEADGVLARYVPTQRYNRATMRLISASRGKRWIGLAVDLQFSRDSTFACPWMATALGRRGWPHFPAACFLPCHRSRREICLDADNPVRGRPGRQLGDGS